MQIHEIVRKTPNKKKRYVARGGKRGKTAGRGTKGQKARAGHKIRPEIRDVIKRLPKLRGYSFKTISGKPEVVNLDSIEKAFSNNETVNPEALLEKNLVRRVEGQAPRVKILGEGEISKKLTFENCGISSSAKAKIEKAGGTIKA